MCERELTVARQDANGSSRSGQALTAEVHTIGRQNSALQQQVVSLQAQLEETLDARQAEVCPCFTVLKVERAKCFNITQRLQVALTHKAESGLLFCCVAVLSLPLKCKICLGVMTLVVEGLTLC